MDNKITKQRIMQKLSYDWLKYIGVLLLVIIFWAGIFTLRFSIKSHEEIILFTSAENIAAKESKKALDALADKGIKKVTYTVYSRESQNYQSILQLKGLGEADLLVLSAADLDSMDCARYFVPINDAMAEKHIPNNIQFEIYKKDGVGYGVMVFSKDNENYNAQLNFNKLISFGEGEDYFLVINGMSQNIGDYSPTGKSKNDAALFAFGFLLSGYSE